MTDRLLYFVRHGESTWNLRQRVQGQYAAPPLTSRGRHQAHGAAAAVAGSGAVRLLTSDAVRARQTSEIIGRRLGLGVRSEPLLRERHWGALQGRSLAEAAAVESSLHPDQPLPGGESRSSVRERLGSLLSSPAIVHAAGPVVLVTHGDVIVEALTLWGHSRSLDTVPGNGSVTPVRVQIPEPHGLVGHGAPATLPAPGGSR